MPHFPKTGVAAALAAISLSCAGGPVSGQSTGEAEEILSFDVRVDVRSGGVFEVREEITVRSLGREIRRGIYRDFPTTFSRERGPGSVVAPFEVISVERDGRPEPHRLESIGGPAGRSGVRVRIGDPDVELPPDVYRYVLAYRTERWLRFGTDRDRIEWNVTGNGWSFPILSASAVVHLPAIADPERVTMEAWTGPTGSTRQDATAAWDSVDGAARFASTTALAPGEGLTVGLSFPTGLVEPPTAEQEAAWFRLDWGGWLDAGLVSGLLVVLYLVLWFRVGRDPEKGVVVVRYDPPEGFSPAALGYLAERGYEARQLSAALVALAVKGRMTIERVGRTWRLRRDARAESVPDLPSEEARLFDALLDDAGTITLSGSSSPAVRKAVKSFRKTLSRRFEHRYFVTNRRWFLAGVAMSLAGFASLAWRYRFQVSPEAWFLGIWLTFWTLGVTTLLFRVGRSWLQARSGDTFSALGALLITAFAVPFVGAEVTVAYQLYQRVPLYLVTAVLFLGGVNVLFYHLLERPTLRGRGVLGELEGFRRFLGATEGDRMDRLQDPDRSLELFERYLPHAIALGLENRWAERFEAALAVGAPEAGRALGWYSGGAGTSFGGMASDLGGSFASSISASSAAPSSGGGGGSGSSGGGGGGGGGGGW